jgi:trigger factor
MNARITEQTDVTATLEITVDAPTVDATFEQMLDALAKNMKVPGFRPGKAPRSMLISRFGEEEFASEVREAIVDEHYPNAVRELNLTPVHAHVHADAPRQGEAFTFTVHTEIFPEFTLANIDDIAIETVEPPITDEDVEATVKRLRDDHVTLVPVDRAAEAGDVVTIETQGEGGQQMPVDLERTEPNLVEQLVGCTIGQALTLNLGEDPNAAPAEAEAGEGAAVQRTLDVVIQDIKTKERPEVDDAFAATLGFGSWDAVVAEIRHGLQSERARESFRIQRDEFVQKLMAATEVSLPPSLVKRKQQGLLNNLRNDLEQRGTSFEQYLASLEERGEREKFEAEWREAADRGVKRDLVLERLMDANGVAVDDREFEQAIRQVAQREQSEVEKFKRERGEDWLSNFRYLLARDKTLEFIVRQKVGTLPVAPDDTREAAAAADAMGAANDE